MSSVQRNEGELLKNEESTMHLVFFLGFFVVYYSVGLKSPCFAVRPWSLLSRTLSLLTTLRYDATYNTMQDRHVRFIRYISIESLVPSPLFLVSSLCLYLRVCLSPSITPHCSLLLVFVFIFAFPRSPCLPLLVCGCCILKNQK